MCLPLLGGNQFIPVPTRLGMSSFPFDFHSIIFQSRFSNHQAVIEAMAQSIYSDFTQLLATVDFVHRFS